MWQRLNQEWGEVLFAIVLGLPALGILLLISIQHFQQIFGIEHEEGFLLFFATYFVSPIFVFRFLMTRKNPVGAAFNGVKGVRWLRYFDIILFFIGPWVVLSNLGYRDILANSSGVHASIAIFLLIALLYFFIRGLVLLPLVKKISTSEARSELRWYCLIVLSFMMLGVLYQYKVFAPWELESDIGLFDISWLVTLIVGSVLFLTSTSLSGKRWLRDFRDFGWRNMGYILPYALIVAAPFWLPWLQKKVLPEGRVQTAFRTTQEQLKTPGIHYVASLETLNFDQILDQRRIQIKDLEYTRFSADKLRKENWEVNNLYNEPDSLNHQLGKLRAYLLQTIANRVDTLWGDFGSANTIVNRMNEGLKEAKLVIASISKKGASFDFRHSESHHLWIYMRSWAIREQRIREILSLELQEVSESKEALADQFEELDYLARSKMALNQWQLNLDHLVLLAELNYQSYYLSNKSWRTDAEGGSKPLRIRSKSKAPMSPDIFHAWVKKRSEFLQLSYNASYRSSQLKLKKYTEYHRYFGASLLLGLIVIILLLWILVKVQGAGSEKPSKLAVPGGFLFLWWKEQNNQHQRSASSDADSTKTVANPYMSLARQLQAFCILIIFLFIPLLKDIDPNRIDPESGTWVTDVDRWFLISRYDLKPAPVSPFPPEPCCGGNVTNIENHYPTKVINSTQSQSCPECTEEVRRSLEELDF